MQLTQQDRQFVMGVLGMLIAVGLIVGGYIRPLTGLAIIGAILAAYGYGEAQLRRDPPDGGGGGGFLFGRNKRP